MGISAAKYKPKHSQTMDMLETEKVTVWLSLANTVLVSIAIVLWYFAISQEEKEEMDETEIVIIGEDKCEESEPQDINESKPTVIDDLMQKEERLDNEYEYEKTETLIDEDDSCYQQTTIDKDTKEVNIEEKVDHNEDDSEPGVQTLIPTQQITPEAVKNVFLGPTFQWPRHADTVEHLRSLRDQSRAEISQDLLDRLQSMGIRRDSPNQSVSTVPLSDSARLSGISLGRRVRISWDTFLAKSRPGLGMDADSPKQRKPTNKKKKKSIKGWKEENMKKQSKSFVEIIRQEDSSKTVCAA